MTLRQQQLGWTPAWATLDVATEMCKADVERRMRAALRDGDEMIKAHVFTGDLLPADVAASTVPFVDRGRIDLFDPHPPQSGATPMGTFLVRILEAFRIRLSPSDSCFTRSLRVGRIPILARVLPTLLAPLRKTVGLALVHIELGRVLLETAHRTRFFRRSLARTSAVMAMAKPLGFTLHPTLLSARAGRKEGKRTATALTEMIAQYGRLFAPMVRRAADLTTTLWTNHTSSIPDPSSGQKGRDSNFRNLPQ